MGQDFSTSLNSVAVWCDKPVYYSGDVINGYVLLNVYEPFTAGSINVEFHGHEKSHWWHYDGQYWHRHGAKKEFFRTNVPIASFDGTLLLARGQYQFPFRLTLPVDLPGSFRYEERRHGYYRSIVGKVKYKLAAEVWQGRPGGRRVHLRTFTEITLRQRLKRAPHELTAETTREVDFCCFSNRGTVTVRIRVEKDSYSAGEAAQIFLEVENHTNLAFPDVRLKVERVVWLMSCSGHTMTRTECVSYHCLPGLSKGESCTGAKRRRLTFHVTPNLEPTTLASHVRCTYHAHVELSAGALTSNPKLNVPLTIYAKPPPHVPYDQEPPEYWHPETVYPAVDVKMQMSNAPPMYVVPHHNPLQEPDLGGKKTAYVAAADVGTANPMYAK